MILKTNVLKQIIKTLKIEPEKPQILQNAVWENSYYSLVTLNIGIKTTVIIYYRNTTLAS